MRIILVRFLLTNLLAYLKTLLIVKQFSRTDGSIISFSLTASMVRRMHQFRL